MPTSFRLAELLEKLGLSQAELVRQSGVSQRTVSRLVHNETEQVSLKVLDAIAAVLGVDSGDLIANTPKRSKK